MELESIRIFELIVWFKLKFLIPTLQEEFIARLLKCYYIQIL